MYQDKKRCAKCKYGWLPHGQPSKLVPYHMCLYYHDTGLHRDGDDETCNSFIELSKEDRTIRNKQAIRAYMDRLWDKSGANKNI